MLKNQNNSECAFAEQIVSYIYDEIDAGDKAAFDAHMPACADCSAELSGLNHAHFSIHEWKAAEFSRLENPKIEIPFDKTQKPRETITVSEKAQSWFFELGKMFKPSTVWSGAFAVLLIFSGLYLLVYNFAKNDEAVTGNNQPLISANTSIASPDDSKNENLIANIAIMPSIDNKEQVPEDSSHESFKKRLVKSSSIAAKFHTENKVAAKNSKSVASSREIFNSNLIAKTKTVQKGKITNKPTLTAEVAEDEEINLRLADLLDEVGGK